VRPWAAIARCAAPLLALAALAGACVTTRVDRTPDPGPGGGSVEVRPDVEPEPGATVVVALSADDVHRGSACVALDEWVDDGWRSRWFWVRTSSDPEPIPEGGSRTCPAVGTSLPTEQTLAIPADLGDGIWRLAYVAGANEVGSYVFEVG
jgi:hypothetical protein